MSEYVSYHKEMQEVTITYGALEEQVGLWLVDIINNKLIWIQLIFSESRNYKTL